MHFIFSNQPEQRRKVKQYRGCLPDHYFAVHQKRRCKRRMLQVGRLHGLQHVGHAFFRDFVETRAARVCAARNVEVIGTGIFKGQPNKFASALNGGPVMQRKFRFFWHVGNRVLVGC